MDFLRPRYKYDTNIICLFDTTLEKIPDNLDNLKRNPFTGYMLLISFLTERYSFDWTSKQGRILHKSGVEKNKIKTLMCIV